MLKTIVKKGSYHDSVVLMLLTNQISSIEGVKKVSIMMATPANKDIYRQSGLSTSELEEASANDMVVVADVDDDGLLDVIMEEVEAFFKKQSTSESDKKGAEAVRSWDKALGKLADANLAVISIPGAYAALEADRALDEGWLLWDRTAVPESSRACPLPLPITWLRDPSASSERQAPASRS